MNRKLFCAITTILSGAPVGAVLANAAADTPASTGDEIQEIMVTAQRRTENLAARADHACRRLPAKPSAQLNVTTFDDFLKYLPNVTSAANGPGQGDIYMRGLALYDQGSKAAARALPSFPNVAVYLDEQSGQLPGRNLDVYAADLERIEVLEGRRARCSAPAHKPAWCATSRTSRNSTSPKATPTPPMKITAHRRSEHATSTPRSMCRSFRTLSPCAP